MKVSVVMSSLNEQYTEATAKDILEKSGEELYEIIIIDDNSDEPIDFKLDKTKIYRNEKRQGLIRSRDKASHYAGGDIVLSIDPHCKVSENWLSPLCERLNNNYKSIVTPATLGLDAKEWKENGAPGYKTIWRWNLDFLWRNDNDGDYTPAVAGHCFAFTKKWWEESGGFDERMNKWGGENIEFTLKSWLCGGTVEVVRDCWCAHMFKKGWTYQMDNNTLLYNKARIAEVWFGDYKDRFYKAVNVENGKIDFGDISRQIDIRDKLQERSMDWFIENIVPELGGVCEFKNVHRGKHFAILGSSPTINDINLDILKNYDVIIGVNYNGLHNKCDYVAFHDYKPAIELLNSKLYHPSRLLVPTKLKDGTKLIPADHKLGWSLYELGSQDFNKSLKNVNPPFFHHATTAHTAAHIAAYMGAKSVTMIGCDGNFSDGRSHADIPEYNGGKYWPNNSQTNNYLRRIARGYDELRIAFNKWNIPLLRIGYL